MNNNDNSSEHFRSTVSGCNQNESTIFFDDIKKARYDHSRLVRNIRFLDFGQCLIQVTDNILNIFNPHRQADEAV